MRHSDKRLPAPTLDEPLELAYLAGFLDGEGCINITTQKSRGNLNYRMQIVLWNTNRAIIESLAAHWAGGFHAGSKTRTNATENARPCYLAWWHGQLADELLARLEPYVRIKHAQLLNAREFQAVKRRRVGRSTSQALLDEMARHHGDDEATYPAHLRLRAAESAG